MTNPGAIAAGMSLNGLHIDTLIGSGGLAAVWRATTAAGEPVALKIPRQDLSSSAGADELVLREFRILSDLSHPQVLKPLGCIELQGRPGLITEYLDGGDLVPLIGAHPRHWARAAYEIAGALVYLHERAVVHRDIKTRNVLFDATGTARLIDFALADDGSETVPRGGGTAAYARLQQREGASSDVADDTHAFAVLLYELLAGRLPFGVEPSMEALRSAPPPLDCGRHGIDPAANRLADLVQAGFCQTQQKAPNGVRPFLDALESLLSIYG